MIPQNNFDAVFHFLLNLHDGTLESTHKQFLQQLENTLLPSCFILYQALCDNILTQKMRFASIYVLNESFRDQFPLSELSGIQSERYFIANLHKEQVFIQPLQQSMDDLGPETNIQSAKCPHMKELRQVIPIIPQLTNQINSVSIQQFRYLNNTFLGFETDFLRPIPSVIQCQCEYIHPTAVNTLWDWTISMNNDELIIAREFIQKASTTKLSYIELQQLYDILKKGKNALECGINCQLFAGITLQNPDISSFFLIHLTSLNVELHDYFECLIKMKVTIQTLEVVNKISGAVILPEAFLHMFINNCIDLCEQSKNKPQHARNVRLVSVFIRTLIKQKILDPKKMFTVLQGFCIENAKQPEAQVLFKVIKQAVENPNDEKFQ